jgi:hypothetical protein
MVAVEESKEDFQHSYVKAAAEQCESSGVQEELSLQLTLGTFK